MKFSKSLLLISGLFLPALTFANTYNGEVELGYVNNGISMLGESSPLHETNSKFLNGIYHFTQVDTTNKPLAEAAFLQKSSFINAGYTDWDIDLANGASGNIQNIGFGFYIPNTMFYVGAQHLRFDYDHSDSDSDTRIELGVSPIDGLLITTEHWNDADSYEANIQAKYVTQLTGDTAINLEAGILDQDDGGNIIHLAADYYFTRQFSVGAGITDYDDGTQYNLRTQYFFNDSMSLTGQFTSDSETDEDAISIGVSARF